MLNYWHIVVWIGLLTKFSELKLVHDTLPFRRFNMINFFMIFN